MNIASQRVKPDPDHPTQSVGAQEAKYKKHFQDMEAAMEGRSPGEDDVPVYSVRYVSAAEPEQSAVEMLVTRCMDAFTLCCIAVFAIGDFVLLMRLVPIMVEHFGRSLDTLVEDDYSIAFAGAGIICSLVFLDVLRNKLRQARVLGQGGEKVE